MTNEPKPTPRATLDDLAIIDAHLNLASQRIAHARTNLVLRPLASIGAITEAFQHAEIATERIRARIHFVDHTQQPSQPESQKT